MAYNHKLKAIRTELFNIFTDVYRNLSFFVLILIFLKFVFHSTLLQYINLSLFLIGIIVVGIIKLVLE